MIRKFFSIMIWFALNFVLPAFLLVFGINLFLLGAGVHFHIDYNSFTILGLWIARAGLPVTPPSKPIKMMPLRTLDPNDPFSKELEKALKKELNRAHQEKEEEHDGGSGPGAPRC
jgi:hypothetical protein